MPPNNNDTPEDILLRGVVRVEKAENPEQYIQGVLKRVKLQHIERTYAVKDFDNATQFLELMARKGGRLLKGGEADVDGVARMVLNDFLRGKLPWFTPPPLLEGQEEKSVPGRRGVLGEMSQKRPVPDKSRNSVEEAEGKSDEEVSEGEEEENEKSEDGLESREDEQNKVEVFTAASRSPSKVVEPPSPENNAREWPAKRRKKG